ncbi:MAG: MFS transporter [Acetobacteraceae bacterium]|nr:MFS transporter [Acetobacteraceae bacterium]
MGKARLVLALGLVAAAQAGPLTALPLLMEALAVGADRLGVAVTAGLLATLALTRRAGALADRIGPPLAARCGLAVICAASAMLCGYTALVLDGTVAPGAAFTVLLGTRAANGVGVALLHPSAQAWLWAGVGEEEGTALQGRASAVQNAGRLFGPLGVAATGGLGAAWTLGALAAVSAFALFVLALAPGPAAPRAGQQRQDGGALRGGSQNGARPLLAALFALHLLGGGAQFLLGPLLVARLDFGAGDAVRWTGWLMALAAAASIAGNLAGRRAPGRRRAPAGAALATAGAVVLAPFADLASVAVGVTALAAGIGAAVPSAMAELMRRSPVWTRGRVAGRTMAMQAAAYAVAAPAGGLLLSASPTIAAASLAVPAAAAWLVLVKAGPARPKAGVPDAGRLGRSGVPHRRRGAVIGGRSDGR